MSDSSSDIYVPSKETPPPFKDRTPDFDEIQYTLFNNLREYIDISCIPLLEELVIDDVRNLV